MIPAVQSVNPPLVSVVIPTFNRPELLVSRALSSALGQRCVQLEVVVVLDGEDPQTRAALATFSDERLRVLELPTKQGASAARNAGVQASQGEWIAFLDDDDEWRPDKLARQLACAQRSRYPYPVVFNGYIGRTPHGDRLHPPRLMDSDESIGDYLMVRRSMAQGECVLVCSMIFAPRSLLLRVPFTSSLRTQEDWDWMLRAEQQPGVGFEQLSRDEASTLTIYYSGESRPAGSRHLAWEAPLDWAREHRRAGRLSNRAFAGFMLSQLAPRAAAKGDWRGLRVMGLDLLSTHPGAVEVMRFLKHWLIPATLRSRARAWLNSRRPPVRLET